MISGFFKWNLMAGLVRSIFAALWPSFCFPSRSLIIINIAISIHFSNSLRSVIWHILIKDSAVCINSSYSHCAACSLLVVDIAISIHFSDSLYSVVRGIFKIYIPIRVNFSYPHNFTAFITIISTLIPLFQISWPAFICSSPILITFFLVMPIISAIRCRILQLIKFSLFSWRLPSTWWAWLHLRLLIWKRLSLAVFLWWRIVGQFLFTLSWL